MKKLRVYKASGNYFVEGQSVSREKYDLALNHNEVYLTLVTITLTAEQAEVLGRLLELWHDRMGTDDHVTLAEIKELL